MSILIIGDLHFKINNFNQIEQFTSQVYDLLKPPGERNYKYKINIENIKHVIFLGDILHNHEKLDTVVLNKVVNFFFKIVEYCPISILVGNHDMINNTNFCNPDGHWLNCLKLNPKIKIVDIPMVLKICNIDFLAVPYVFPGRFKEALDKFGFNPDNFDFCLAHQEFKKCKMGSFESEIGDEYNFDTKCISGHIHNYQEYGNIIYTGSAFEHSFGSDKCWLFVLNIEKKDLLKIESRVDSKKIFYCKLKKNDQNYFLDTKLKIPSSGKKLNKINLKIDNIQEYKHWLETDLGKEIVKNYTIQFVLQKCENNKVVQDNIDKNLFEKYFLETCSNLKLKNLIKEIQDS